VRPQASIHANTYIHSGYFHADWWLIKVRSEWSRPKRGGEMEKKNKKKTK